MVWTNKPPVLDMPVDNPEERADDAGYKIRPGKELRAIRDILSELMGVPKATYKGLLQCWFCQYMFEHPVSKAWWYL